MPVGKKLTIYYVLGFVGLFLVVLVQIALGEINPFLLFSLSGVIIFLGGALYEQRLTSEMYDFLKVYYHDGKKAEQHMKMYSKFRKVKFFIGMVFLASAAMCFKSSYNSFGEYISVLQMPKSVAGATAIIISCILYSLSDKIYSNAYSNKFPGGITAFKASCVLIMIIGLIFLGI